MSVLYGRRARQALLGVVAAAFLFSATLVKPLAQQQPPAASGSTSSQGTSVSPYGVGGDVTAPVPVYKPEPAYSEEARRAKFQGTTVLWIVVDASGQVSDVHVTRPLGMGLDEKAIQAIRTWQFKPATRKGSPVRVRVIVEITFRLFNGCRVPFANAEMDGDDASQIAWGQFPKDALSWWTEEKGTTEFPLVCPTDRWSAKYAIVWRKSSPSKGVRAGVYKMGAGGNIQSPALFTSKETKSAMRAFKDAVKYLNGEASRAQRGERVD
jgi:TonB family protein